MNSYELGEKLQHHFYSKKGYLATKTGEIRPDGKVKKTYERIFRDITQQDYNNHVNTAKGLTPSPLIEDRCWWGAIDIDTYDLSFEDQKKILEKAKDLKLVPELTTSGGFHLYAFTSEDKGVEARTMSDFLMYCLRQLGLPLNTERFPKQSNTDKGKGVGNGLTIPYWNYRSLKDKANCGCAVWKDKIIKLDPETWFRTVEANQYTEAQLKVLAKTEFLETPDQKEQTDDYTPGSMQDPDMQKLTGRELIQKIQKEKMSIEDDSFFDDLVTLYIGKGVSNRRTDEEILTPLFEKLDPDVTKVDAEYYREKLERSRRNLEIEDPKVAREKFIKRIVFIKEGAEYFDLKVSKIYPKEAIDFEYQILFGGKQPINPTTWLKRQPKRISVEGFKCRPDLYKEGDPIFKVGNFKYINSYRPNDLVAEKGDTKPFHDLLDHIFDGKMKHKEHFLDWISFVGQHPGIKIRYALIIVSTSFQFGKGTLWKILEKVFGLHNALAIDVEQAIDKSKTYLINTQLVLIDEMESSGTFDEKKKLLNSLKRIITESVASSRELYKDYTIVETCTNYILFSNKKDALSLPPNEVRYWVYITDRPRKNDEFYKKIYDWLENGGAKHVLYELKERDVEDFNPKSTAPHTVFREQMSVAGEHPLTKLTREMFEEEEFPFTRDRVVIGSMELFNWLKKNNKLGIARINEVKNALEGIGGRDLGQIRITLGNKTIKPTLYLIRDHEEYEGKQSPDFAKLYTPLYEEDSE